MLFGTRRSLLGGREALWDPTKPLPVSGLLPAHWYRSDQGLWQDAGITPAAADGDPIGRWEDLTANADHVAQGTAAKRPTLQNGAADLINGHPVVRFDGTDDSLVGAFTNGGVMAQPNTIFAVAALDASRVDADAFDYIFDDSSTANNQALGGYGAATPDVWRIRASTELHGSIATSANPTIFTCLYNGMTSQFWMNGVSAALGDTGAFSMNGLTLGTRRDGVAPFKGDILELLCYNPNLPDADKNTVGQYAALRYALAYTDI